MRDGDMNPDRVGEIIHQACNEEQRLPDLSLGNQFANTINPRSPCRSSPVLAWQETAPVSSSDLRPTRWQRAFLPVERERRRLRNHRQDVRQEEWGHQSFRTASPPHPTTVPPMTTLPAR